MPSFRSRATINTPSHFACSSSARFPEVASLTAELLEDHRRLMALANTLRTVSRHVILGQFVALLEEHVRKEERSLFEQAQPVLTRAELDRFGCI